jgi:O-antigen ligase
MPDYQRSWALRWCLGVLGAVLFLLPLELLRALMMGDGTLGRVSAFLISWQWWLLSAALLLFLVDMLREDRRFRQLLRQVLVGSGAFVAMIGISHWFYDSGKLLWIFAPEEVFVSPRARWPFVNSNHLAHYLTMSLALGFGLLAVALQKLKRAEPGAPRDRHLVRAMMAMGILLMISVAILGTLSRGAWLSIGFGAPVFYLLTRGASGQSSSRGGWRSMLRWLPLALFIVAIGTLLSAGRGSDLIEDRVVYGLSASRDDLRWELYRDTSTLLAQYPLFGVGLGRWEVEHGRVASEALTDLEPEYLHSDPYQVLIEAGLLGTVPFLVLALILLRRIWQTSRLLRSTGDFERTLSFGASCTALLVLVCASLVDFPFRIPAIHLTFLVILALVLVAVREENSTNSK